MKVWAFVQEGGLIGYILVALSVIGMTQMVWKCVQLWLFNKHQQHLIPGQILNRVRSVEMDGHVIVETIRTEVDVKFSPLEKGLTTIGNIASVAPLLGLLGTVIGIFNAFGTIAEIGLDDPTAFASGIKLALVTTVLGLIVAIPHLIGYNYLLDLVEKEKDEVENEVLLQLGQNLIKRVKEEA